MCVCIYVSSVLAGKYLLSLSCYISILLNKIGHTLLQSEIEQSLKQ